MGQNNLDTDSWWPWMGAEEPFPNPSREPQAFIAVLNIRENKPDTVYS